MKLIENYECDDDHYLFIRNAKMKILWYFSARKLP